MQKVLLISQINHIEEHLEKRVLGYINEGQIESFEGFPTFSVMAFDWYDVNGESQDFLKVMVYLDRDDIFFFCENDAVRQKVEGLAESILREHTDGPVQNERLMFRFFSKLIKDDMKHMDVMEQRITDAEDGILSGDKELYADKIIEYRRELIHLKRYYEQLYSIFDELSTNDNKLLSECASARFDVLSGRIQRYLSNISNLKEYVAQLREAYQAQIDIEQNELMKVFTVVTAVFMPLTLIAGWYGMNLMMPECHWKYSYAAVIGASVLIVVGMIGYFKKKNWF